MKIDNEFSVGVPIARAWEILNDIPAIAPCMPGAQLTGSDGDTHEGKVKVKVGPITSEYKGKATFIEKDQAAGKMVIKGEGRDTRGAGNASADIHLQMTEAGDRTNIAVNTNLKITGKVAQFGRGVIVDISEKLLGQFVDCLEQKIMTMEQDAAKIAGAGAQMSDAGAGAEAVTETASSAGGAVAAAGGAAAAGVAGTAGAMGIGRKVDGDVSEIPEGADPESYRTECFPGTDADASGAAETVAGTGGDVASGAAGAVSGAASGAAGAAGAAVDGITGKAADLAGGVGGGAAAAAAGAGALAAGGLASAKGAMGGAKGAVGGATEEVEALDLMDIAGSALWKRFIPLIVLGVIALIVIIWLIAR